MTARNTAGKATKPSAKRAAKPAAKRTTTSTPRRSAQPTGVGLARTVRINRPEVHQFLTYLDLPAPSVLSPFPDLMAPGAKGTPRHIDEVTSDLAGLSKPAMQFAFSPMAIPDRIVDLRSTVFNGAPSPTRLYGSRQYEEIFAGLRPGMDFDYELLAPFTVEELEVSARMQFQFSAARELPMTQIEFSAEQLAFLFAVVDAFKGAFVRSFTVRRPEPSPVLITMADILEAETLARSQPDRRWISHAIGELLSVLVHPGGTTGLGLPMVNEDVATREIRRYVSEGLMSAARRGANPTLELHPTLAVFAGSLFTWISLLSIHDMQVAGFSGGRPQAQEEALLYIVTEPTLWAVATEGLTRAERDLSAVTFGLRSLDLVAATQLASDFLRAAPGLELPDALYAPTSLDGRVEVDLPVSYEAPVWSATHVIPAGGTRAWDAPDPTKAPITEVASGLEVQVVEQQGAWVRVVFSNGWSTWVDGRVLKEVGR